MNTNPSTITAKHDQLISLRDRAFNLAQDIQDCQIAFTTLQTDMRGYGLGNLERVAGESDVEYLGRLHIGLTAIAAEMLKAEELKNAREDIASLSAAKPVSTSEGINNRRPTTKFGRVLNRIARKF